MEEEETHSGNRKTIHIAEREPDVTRPDVPTKTTVCDVHWMQYAPAKNKTVRYSRLRQCIYVLETRQSETRTVGLQNVNRYCYAQHELQGSRIGKPTK